MLIQQNGIMFTRRNPSSHEWEPLLEPFHIGASLHLESVKEGAEALSTKLSCLAHNPLLLNVRAPSLYRLAGLGPVYQASLEGGCKADRTRFRCSAFGRLWATLRCTEPLGAHAAAGVPRRGAARALPGACAGWPRGVLRGASKG